MSEGSLCAQLAVDKAKGERATAMRLGMRLGVTRDSVDDSIRMDLDIEQHYQHGRLWKPGSDNKRENRMNASSAEHIRC